MSHRICAGQSQTEIVTWQADTVIIIISALIPNVGTGVNVTVIRDDSAATRWGHQHVERLRLA